jgi:hypothetical protein
MFTTLLLRALEHVYNYVVCGPWNMFATLLLRSLEHIYNYVVCGPWNMFTTMLSAGPGTRYIFDIPVLEPIYNNNMFTTMLFAGPGTHLWRETIGCVCVCAVCGEEGRTILTNNYWTVSSAINH